MINLLIRALLIPFVIVIAGHSCPRPAVLPNNQETVEICPTENCKHIAYNMKRGMDMSVKPCDNFYQHMCGKWIKNNPITNDEPSIDWHSAMTKVVKQQIQDIFTNTTYTRHSESILIAKALFNMCMDIDTINKDGIHPLLDVIKRMGGWPILHRLNDPEYTLFSWQYHLEEMYKIVTHSAFYVLKYVPDSKMPHIQRLMLQEPQLALHHSLNKNGAMVQTYKAYIYHIVKYICAGAERTVSEFQLNQDINDMIDLEMELSTIVTPTAFSNSQDNYKVTTVEQFQKIYDNHGGKHPHAMFDWLNKLKEEIGKPELDITKSEIIIVKYISYFTKLPKILKKYRSRTLVNYMAWNLVRSIIPLGDSKLAHIAFRFKQKMNSMNKDKTRSETCLEIPNLSEAISYEYIKNYFSEETKKQVKTIVDLIINKMTEGVKSTVWMDEKIKTLLTQKIQNIGKLVGYPDYYSKSFIDQMYKDYRFGPNFMESVLNFLKFNANYNFRQIRRTFSRDRWVRRPTDVIASYIVTANSINIPAAILQPPIFQIDRPAVLNFAIIGFIIAHEISHSFDIQGRKFDKDGNVIDSWSPEMIEIYRVLSLCFIDQYNKYPVPKLPNRKRICLDGYLTLGENIADTIALLIAFHTYKQFKMENGNKDVRLPTLNEYTSEQLFFMYLAYFHCTNMNPKIIEKKLKTDCHAPRQFRLIGSISNNPDFGKAFNCTIGDPMYPANRCSILVL